MPEIAGSDPCAALEQALAEAQAQLARHRATIAELNGQLSAIEKGLDDGLGDGVRNEFGGRGGGSGDLTDALIEVQHSVDWDLVRVTDAQRRLALCRAKNPVEPEAHVTATPLFEILPEPEVQIMIGATPPAFTPETIIIDMPAAPAVAVGPCAAEEKAVADAQAQLARDQAEWDDGKRAVEQLEDEFSTINAADREYGGAAHDRAQDLSLRIAQAVRVNWHSSSLVYEDKQRLKRAEQALAACRAKKSVETETRTVIGTPPPIVETIVIDMPVTPPEPEVQIMIGATPPIFPTKVESVVDDLGDQAGRPLTTKGRSDQQKRAAVAVGLVILVVLLGVGGYAATQGAPAQSQPPTPTASQAVATPTPRGPVIVVPIQVVKNQALQIITGPDPCKNKTLHFVWGISGAKPGDAITISYTGPGLPPTGSGVLDADGGFFQDFPVSGSGVWTSEVTSIAGSPPPASVANKNTTISRGCP